MDHAVDGLLELMSIQKQNSGRYDDLAQIADNLNSGEKVVLSGVTNKMK
ncbi:MAG: hypothetical protein AAF717_08720 [Bacteroidota bacterium]